MAIAPLAFSQLATTGVTADPRAELERLRKLKRLKELEAKASGAAPQPAPAQSAAASTADPLAPRNTSGYDRNAVEQGIRDAAYTNEMQQLGIIKRGSDLLTAPQAQPKTPARFGFKWEKRGNDWVEVSANQAKQPNELERFAGDVGRAVAAPFQQNENLRTVAGAPLNLGDGLARGSANAFNNVSAVGTEAVNAGLNQLDPSRQQFTAPRIEVPQNVIVGEGGFLNSEAGVVPNMVGQIAAARVPLGTVSRGGGVANLAAKDAAAMALTTDAKAPRVSDMIPRTGMGAALDPLRSGENDPTIVSMMKNLGEDLIFSGAGEAMLAGGAKALEAGRKLLPQSPVAPNSGGANLGSPRPMPAQTPANALASPPAPAQAASAAQPSVAPQPTVSQAGTAGAGQQAGAGVGAGGGGAVPPAGPATLQATPRRVPAAIDPEEIANNRAAVISISRFMRSARIPRNVVNDYVATLLSRYEPLKSERYPLAFFVEEDLPQYLESRGYSPDKARNLAGDVAVKTTGYGKAANSFTGSGNSSRYTMQDTIHQLTSTQKSELEGTFKAVLGDETLMGRSDEIGALMRQNGEQAYNNSIAEANRVLQSGQASPEQIKAAQELNAILTNDGFKQFYPDSLTVEAATRGKTVDELIQERLAADPIDAAHWLQSKIGESARDARNSLNSDMASTYEAMRKAILDRLEQFPGYRGARMQHGDLFGADEAISFGDRFLSVAKSEFQTEKMARELEKLSPRQQQVAALSIRDALLNQIIRLSPEEAPARITQLQNEGTLKALVTVLGEERGNELRDAIASMRVENQRIAGVSQAHGSPTHLLQQGAKDAVDNVRGPGNRVIHAAGNPAGWGMAGAVSIALGNPLPLVAKGAASLVDKLSTPTAKFQSRATRGLYGLPNVADDAAGAVPPNANALASPPPSGGPTPFGGAGGGNTTGNALSRPPPRTRAQRPPPTVEELAQRIAKDQNELQTLLKRYDQIDRAEPNVDDLMRDNLNKQRNARRRIAEKTKKMEAARAAQPEPEPAVPNAPQIAPANAFNAEPQPAPQAPAGGNAFNGKRALPGETSNASPAVTGALVTGGLTGGATYAATGDEDLALKAGGLGALGGGFAANRLSKLGASKLAPKPRAPVAKVPFRRDPALANLSPGDIVGYIEAKYPPAAPNLQPPYFTAANAIKRANGDRAAATKELADYAAYLKQSNSAPEVIENAERTVRAVADVDPIFFDDAAFNASMKGRIEAGGTAAMEQGAKPAATSARSSVTPLKPAPKPPTRKNAAGGIGAAGGGIVGYATAPDTNKDGKVDNQERFNGAFGGMVSGGIGGAVAGRALGAFGRGANKLAGGPERAGNRMNQQTFGGVNAKTADRVALGRAQNMEAEGASREDILRQTGWFKQHGQWKFEIDDSGATIRDPSFFFTASGPQRLQDQLDHPAAVAAYPDVNPALEPTRFNTGTFYAERDAMAVPSVLPRKAYTDAKHFGHYADNQREITLHENQHAIQRQEAFPKGGNPDSVLDDELASLNTRLSDVAREMDELRKSRNYSKNPARIDEQVAALKEEYDLLMDKRSLDFGRDARYAAYQRLAGETEARNVQTRRDFTPEQRRARPPWTTQDVPDDQQIVRFGSGKAESRPPSFGSGRPKPPANRLAVPKQLAASLNKSKVSPPLREKLNANAALPPGERKSIMEATGWDNEILRIAAPFIREGTRMDTEIGAKVAALIKQANQNPVEYALQQQMARSAMQIAETELKTARRAQGQATRALNTQRERNLGNPNTDQVRQITEPYRQRRAETELAVSEAARMRDEARAAAERANIQLAGLEETRAYAQREIQRITDALGANRPNTKGTAMLPAYNPMGKPKPGPINPAGAKPNKQAAEELAHMLFEADQAELFAKLQAGDITPQNRKALGMAASYYARHPGMAVLTAAGATVTGAGAISIYADQKKRSEDVREVARQRQAEPERPGFKWDWDTQSKKRDFVFTLQSALNDLGYEIGSVDGSMIRADGKQTKTQKALEHFLWSLDNTRVPGSPVTEDDWKAIEREALAARRKRA